MCWVASAPAGLLREVLEKGQTITCQVLDVGQAGKRIALGSKQLRQDPWESDIPERYGPGDVVTNNVTKLTDFGAFVELEPGLEGLLHISELADHKVESPEEVIAVGDSIEDGFDPPPTRSPGPPPGRVVLRAASWAGVRG